MIPLTMTLPEAIFGSVCVVAICALTGFAIWRATR